MRIKTLILTVAVLLFTASCASFRVDLPEGFALIEEGERFIAVSPEGLRYRVKIEDNYPVKDVEFWKAALVRQLEEEGYAPWGDGEYFDCPAGRGFFIEWNVPYGGETYTYLTGIVPQGDVIYVAESAAEFSIYKTYRDALIESMKSISPE